MYTRISSIFLLVFIATVPQVSAQTYNLPTTAAKLPYGWAATALKTMRWSLSLSKGPCSFV